MKTVMSFSLDEELRERLVEEAKRHNQPVSWFVRDVLAEALKDAHAVKRNRSNRNAMPVRQ